MTDRIDELKGNVKKGIGSLTGNKRLETEGEIESDAARANRNAKGVVREVSGAVKEGVGKLTGDAATQVEGTAEKLRGKADQTD